VGILAYLPTAATGAHDWVDEADRTRRAGLVHAAANTVGLGLQVASWVARGRGRQARAVSLSTVAMGALGVGGYIGGHMSYVQGAGVSRTAFQAAPEGWTPTVPAADLGEDPVRADVDGTPVLLVRDGGTIRALADTCTHAGCSLAEGEISDGCVVCPCHGSRFALADGAVEAGPAHTAQPVFATRVIDGVVEVRESR
jgi:nitrite reductase/ring-hydroxylating ferredoxin subunit